LASDKQINDAFVTLASEPDSSIAVNAGDLVRLFPIFDVKTLIKDNLLRLGGGDKRDDLREFYVTNGVTAFEPRCWKRHVDDGEAVPLDWPHVLKAIYKVRCNLFHGQKSAHSEMDKEIVSAAFLTLAHFVREARYLDDR